MFSVILYQVGVEWNSMPKKAYQDLLYIYGTLS